jgi:DNA primase
MTKRRFSNQELYTLRNKIPIEMLIKSSLYIPSKIIEGYFRFLCPLCNGLDTCVNPETNLARCFRCEKNYNTIDLVMLIKGWDFVQSIKFLKKIYNGMSASRYNIPLEAESDKVSQDSSRNESTPQIEKSDNKPEHVGKILGNILSKHSVDYPEKRLINNNRKEKISLEHNITKDRILKLEQKVDLLVHQIEKMLRSMHIDNPSC